MAGPAIRAVELAKQLAYDFNVSVFSPHGTDMASAGELGAPESLELCAGVGKHRLYDLAAGSDILFIQANVLKPYPALAALGKHLVVDLYDPYLFSVLAEYANGGVENSHYYNLMHKVLETHMKQADFSVCASERQRDYWLGRYCSLGRLTPQLYGMDSSFRKLIDVVPFGLPDAPPVRTGPGMRGNIPGIGKDDFVLLWGGGIWEWFDPLTVIKAVGQLVGKYPALKLYFMGWRSPNPHVQLMDMALRAKELARKLDLLDRHVFFSDTWVAYSERPNYLLDASAAISAHFDVTETRFSFRTRILDYLWAGLPVITTCGDDLADMIERQPAGFAVPYQDVPAWCAAIEALITNQQLYASLRAGSVALAERFRWRRVVEPLRDFCANPHKLPPFRKIKMPTPLDRACAIYRRGGKDMLFKRLQEMLQDAMP
jgi:glycosyltransferase involved in cell wall biosynthesis